MAEGGKEDLRELWRLKKRRQARNADARRKDVLAHKVKEKYHARKAEEAALQRKLEKLTLGEEDYFMGEIGQKEPSPFQKYLAPRTLANVQKIGEGSYGEVFRIFRARKPAILKIVPVGGDLEVNGSAQKSFGEILPEIVITKELSSLDGFVQVNDVKVVKGKYPEGLLAAFDDFKASQPEERAQNDRPDFLPEDQKFVVCEFADGGSDLDSFKVESAAQAVSILRQVACALAAAEEACQFEHRDLHAGNVLIKPTQETRIATTLPDGTPLTFNSEGVRVTIIDYTLSRITKADEVYFTDLSQDPDIFLGTERELQFKIYRQMRDETKNEWKKFCPKTNVLWLHYLCDKLSRVVQSQKEGREKLKQCAKSVTSYDSAARFVKEDDLFKV